MLLAVAVVPIAVMLAAESLSSIDWRVAESFITEPSVLRIGARATLLASCFAHRSKYSSQAGHLIPILKNCVPDSLFGP